MTHDIEKITAWLSRLGPPPMGKAIKTEMTGTEIIGHGRDVKGYWLRREYYIPESYGDDDLSGTGYALKPRMGSTRQAVEIYDTNRETLLTRITELG